MCVLCTLHICVSVVMQAIHVMCVTCVCVYCHTSHSKHSNERLHAARFAPHHSHCMNEITWNCSSQSTVLSHVTFACTWRVTSMPQSNDAHRSHCMHAKHVRLARPCTTLRRHVVNMCDNRHSNTLYIIYVMRSA